ncbi:MAG: DUF411 domain-containing protein [Pseudomonadota bacterium]
MKSCLTHSARVLAIAGLVTLSACSDKPATEPAPAAAQATVIADQAREGLKPQITVYKSESCGCCGEWVTYLSEEGFDVTAINHENMDAIKVQLGLPKAELKSCHTAVVNEYLVEGHVPASDILRLLKEQPSDIKGLSAPGMPMNSPGMASRTPKDYAVLAFTAEGDTHVYSQY